MKCCPREVKKLRASKGPFQLADQLVHHEETLVLVTAADEQAKPIFDPVHEEPLENDPVLIEQSPDAVVLTVVDLPLVALQLSSTGVGDFALTPHLPTVKIPLVDSAILV